MMKKGKNGPFFNDEEGLRNFNSMSIKWTQILSF